MGWDTVGWGMGDAGGGGSGRSCRCVFPIPDYRPPPPPDFLHQITSTSWSNPFLLSSIVLHCNRNGGKTVGYKADTFNWPNCPAAKRLMADSHDPIRSNGSRQDSIQKHPQILGYFKSGHRPAFRGTQKHFYVQQLYVLYTEGMLSVRAVKF